MQPPFKKDLQYYKFCFYGFFKNLRFFDAFLMLFFLEKGISFLEIGILYSTREVVILLMEIPSGIISDALGRRKTLISSFFVYILSFIAFFFSSNYLTLIVAMMLFALADAFRSGVHKAMIFQYLKLNNWDSHKIDYYGHTRSWSQSGSAISTLVAAFFVFYFEGYDIIFIASVIPYLIGMYLIYTYPKILDGETIQISRTKVKERFIVVMIAAKKTVSQFSFFKVLTNLTIYTGYYKAVKDYIQPLLKHIALAMPLFAYLNNEKKIAITTGIIYSVLYILTAISSKYSGKFTQLFKEYYKPMNITLLVGLFIGMITGITFGLNMYYIPLIGFVIIMIIENLRKPIGIGIVANISKDESMATILSITSQVKSIFAAIIAPVIGLVADRYNPGIGITTVSIVLIVFLPFYWLKARKK